MEKKYFSHFQAIIDAMPMTVNLFTENLELVYCNQLAADLFETKDKAEYIERFYDLSPKFQPNGILSAEAIVEHLEKALATGSDRFNWLHCKLNGDEIPCEIILNCFELDNVKSVVGYARDLRSEFLGNDNTECYEHYFVNRIPEKALLNMMSELSNEWFFSFDIRTSTLHYYGSISENFDKSNHSFIPLDSLPERGIIHQEDIDLFMRFVNNMRQGIDESFDIRYRQNDGSYRYFRLAHKIIKDFQGNPILVVGKGIDVHEQKLLEERSKIDLLTECYNKVTAEQLIELKLESSSPEDNHVLFIIDIDNFKSINDNLGHFFGDQVLKEVSHNLKTSFRSQDIVARIGGDEFIVFVENSTDISFLESKADKVLEAFSKKYSGADRDYSISGSIGIAQFPMAGSNYEQLYQSADKALYQAKLLGKNRYVFYDHTLVDGTMSNLTRVENTNRVAGSYFDYDLISVVFNILYSHNANEASVNSALDVIGRKYATDRCYIFETLDNGLTYSNTYEWCNDNIMQAIDTLQELPGELFGELFENASDNGIVYTNDLRSIFTENESYKIMADQGILSFAHAQVRKGDHVTFFLGLDDCTKARVWNEKELNSLIYIAKIISLILQSKNLQSEINELNEYNTISAYLSDYTNDLVYLSDIDTYELLHVNKAILEVLGNPEPSLWKGKKCYEILQGKTAPCEFCTNHILSPDNFYEWTFFNPNFNKLYFLRDSLVSMGDKLVRLEVATDITKLDYLESELKEKLNDERLLISCINTLHSGETPHVSVDRLLEIVANYYEADRSYIFEFNETGEYINNTYEWCAKDVEPQISILQNLERATLQTWYDRYDEVGEFYIDSLSDDIPHDSPEYNLLAVQNITSLVTAPIRDSEGVLTGFIGVDNPKLNIRKTLLMRSISRFVANFLDETQLLATLNKLSYYDTLTGIKNRHSFSKTLKKIDTLSFSSLGVAYIDIAELSSINEMNGTEHGDQVIIRLGNIIKSVFGDNSYRVGGDEFVVINVDVSEEQFEHELDMLKSKIAKESDFEANVGYTWNKAFHNTSKPVPSNKSRYSEILSTNLDIEIENDKFVVYLQPQVDIENGSVSSCEALIRRVGGDGNLQPPDSFIPFYEKEGMITKIDLFVFETVCKAIRSWIDRGLDRGVSIAVNCSRMTIIEANLVDKLCAICEKHNIATSRIVIEITETVNSVSEKKMSDIAKKFSAVGFKMSLDDFGSGSSNLSTLKHSDFDEVKIDRSLTSEIITDSKSRLLTQFVLDLCNDLKNIVTVAEGIEYEEQFLLLKKMNCQKGQGYFFAKPMPIDAFNKLYIES